VRFNYPKAQFIIRFLAIGTMLSIVVAVLWVPETDRFWPAAFLALGISASFLVALGPALTAHEVGDAGVILRQGPVLRLSLDFCNIESVEPVAMRLWAFWLFPAGATRGRLVLASGSRNLVSIKLRKKMRFPQLLWRTSDEIIIDLVEPDAFVREVRARLD
jgi:hypothetical protein